MSPIRVRPLAVLAVACAALLSGCGEVPAFNPGVAARVGDQTVTTSRVDDVSDAFCQVVAKQQNAVAVPQHYIRGYVAGTLALRSAAEQLAEQYGVTAPPEYTQQVNRLEQSFSTLPEDELSALVEVQGNQYYVAGIVQSVGEAVLREQGRSTSRGKAVAAGEETLTAWLDDHDVTVNPEFGVELKNGQAVPVDTNVSYALSDAAQQGGASQPDQSYADSLPQSQRCG